MDPLWLLENTTLDQIECWLLACLEALDAKRSWERKDRLGSTPLFSDWEKSFIKSIDDQYNAKHTRGFHDRPLSGKQLFVLRQLYARVAMDVALAMEGGIDG